MNPVLILSYNALPLLRQCIESVRAQDIPTRITVFDNGSVDGTQEWLSVEYPEVLSIISPKNVGVSHGWNQLLGVCAFNKVDNAEHALVLNQDVVLPPFFYRELLAKEVPLVTGHPVTSLDAINTIEDWMVLAPCFSAFLIRRECWEKVGPFWEQDEDGNGLFSWCNDCDYHVRGHRLGVTMFKVGIPFYHVGSTVIASAPPREKRQLEMQADADRMTFADRWKARVGSPQYQDLFSPDSFGIDAD